MFDAITLVRVLLIPLSVVSVFLTVKILKPPRRVWRVALKFCWIAGVLNLIADFFEQQHGFWHYAVNGLVFGLFPLDLYVVVSFVVGGTFSIIYWWLRSYHRVSAVLFMAALPFLILLGDYTISFSTGIMVRDSTFWWLADFFFIIVIVWGTLFVINYLLKQGSNTSTLKID